MTASMSCRRGEPVVVWQWMVARALSASWPAVMLTVRRCATVLGSTLMARPRAERSAGASSGAAVAHMTVRARNRERS
ncbi:hypothetical protein EDC01DRAFT_658427, partial [Geopyxis carbonaria]